MTSKPIRKSLVFAIIWSVIIGGCSTSTPAPIETATETAISTKTSIPSATITSTPKPSPTPYNGPNILFYIEEDNRLFSIHADGSNQREIAQGVAFSVSPDKKKLVYRTAETYFSDTDEVVVMDLAAENIILRWQIPGYCDGFFMSSYFAWSPDSHKIAFTLTRHDGVDTAPNCELEYNYQDMGIYQIDLTTGKTTHPPLIDEFLYDLLHANLSYSPDSSKLRIGTRGQVFDAETWGQVASEPYYDLLWLDNQPEKIGICGDFNLCLYDHKSQIVKYITQHDKSWEGVETFKLFPNSSAVAYQTQEYQLHLLSLSNESDEIIGTNVWDYFITPDNGKIVFYERDRFVEDAGVFVVNSDGSNKHRIAEFPQRRAAIYGPLMAISPTGEKVAFVNPDGIAIIDLDGNGFVQLVHLPDGAPTDKISLEILDWY